MVLLARMSHSTPKTALDLCESGWKGYRLPSRVVSDPVRHAQALARAREIAEMLRTRFGAKKVAAFGSLAMATSFSRASDIDLVVWGLPPNRYFKAVVAAVDLSKEFEVDLVEIDSASPELLKEIESKNVVV